MLWEENENRKELSYPSRVYVLLLFAWIGTMQCYCWYTFGSLPDKFASYFHLSKDQGDSFATLTLNLGPIAFLPIVPFSSYALGKKGGKPLRIFEDTEISTCLIPLKWKMRFRNTLRVSSGMLTLSLKSHIV